MEPCTRSDGNVSLVAAVSKDLTGRVKAGELVKKLSAIVGGGGGGPSGGPRNRFQGTDEGIGDKIDVEQQESVGEV